MMMLMLMIIIVNVLVNNDEQTTAHHIDLPMNVIRRNSFLIQRFHVNNINNNYNVRRVSVIHCS